MACRGWYTALLPHEASIILDAPDIFSRVEELNSLYTSANADGRVLTVDKSWDAMHRVLCDGWLDRIHGEDAMRACVIGAHQLSDDTSWIISYVDAVLVNRVSIAIATIQESWFRARYFALDRNPPGRRVHRYEYPLSDEDFECTWGYFKDVQKFYKSGSQRSLAVVFAADQ